MDWRWRFEVEQSFTITNRGTAVVGELHGTVMMIGESAVICIGDSCDTIEKVSPEICGNRPALLLYGVDKRRVPPGSVVRSID